jgi:branched-chain amino acid aminotransferase
VSNAAQLVQNVKGIGSMSAIPYDQRDGVLWLDGAMVPWPDAQLHVLSHALHYASAVFEGERVYNGNIFKLTEHTQRLHESANILGFDIPWTVAEIDKACRDMVAAHCLTEGYVRPIAWRGPEQMGVSPRGTRIHLAIAAWNWGSYFNPSERLQGIRLRMADFRRPDPATAPTNSKAAGLYMICTLEKHKAEEEGFADAFFLDWRGQIAEATGANVFFVKGGQLHTPVADCFLDGITRRTIIDLAEKRGIAVVERSIMPEEMPGFEECFLTGTAAEVTPVAAIGENSFIPGRISETLMNDYTELVNA